MRLFNALAVLVELRDAEVLAVVRGCITESERMRGWKVRSARWSQHWKWAGSEGWGFDKVYVETGGKRGPSEVWEVNGGALDGMRTAERVAEGEGVK